jgi:hypothetical protein
MRITLAILITLFLAGCAVVRSQVAVFHELPVKTEPIKYAVMPLKEQEGSLEHKSYERLVKIELNKKGFVDASLADAEVIVFLDYGIDSGKEVISSYPIIGRTGTSSSYSSGMVSSYGGYATYSGTTYNRPTYGVVGSGARSDTVFSRFLRLDILDKSSLTDGKVTKLYEAKVTSAGASGQVAAVMPQMLKALFEEFPGKSGTTRQVDVPFQR